MTIQNLHLIIYLSIFGQYFFPHQTKYKNFEIAYNNVDFYLGMLSQF